MDQPPPTGGPGWLSPAALRLAGYSFLILFFELALIRYVSAYVRVFGFYLNLVLIATFLGMGVGLLRADRAGWLRWLGAPMLVGLLATVQRFSNVIVRRPLDPNEFIWGEFFEIAPTVRQVGLTSTVAILFALCALLFVPLGALLGREFRKFPPLTAYSIDIAGSLLGILAFAAASALRTPPLVWFGLACGVWVLLSSRDWKLSGVLVLASIASLLLVSRTGRRKPEYWSPYYRINVFSFENPDRSSLHVNGSMHQWVLDFDTAHAARHPMLAAIRADYTRPYGLLARLDTVLVVGAGTGNDVAVLLAAGARHVDAVEIDPQILDLGRELHFQRPYADPRVETFVDDARHYLRTSRRSYDAIIFGTLDSQTLLSGMTTLRLDNYVYTLESFRSARAHLKPGGSLVTYHMSHRPYIAAKIYQTLAVAFGAPPLVFYNEPWRLFNYTFVAGAAAAHGASMPYHWLEQPVALPHDDWPYLYLRARTIPDHYRSVLGAILLVALGLVGLAAPRLFAPGGGGVDFPMFGMGAGFLLIETKSVTEMSLLFGSTWTVNLLVFASILVVILGANQLAARRRETSLRGPFLGLFASLAVAWAVPVRSLLWLGAVGQWLVGGLLVALPVFFAAIVFARLLASRADATRALGFNLLGAIVGGVLEYLSMVTGTKGLYLIAAAAYGGTWLAHRSTGPRRATTLT